MLQFDRQIVKMAMATAVDELTEEDESKFTSLDLDLDSNNIDIDNMPKRDGRKGKKANCLLQSSDLTLQQFADCSMPQSCSRVKKSVVGATAPLSVISKSSSQQEIKEEELDWFEKDLDDFVIDDKQEEEEEEDSCVVISKPAKKEKKVERKEEKSGVNWPIDLWDILSNYIHPEDISRFSRLCKSCYAITQLSSFWRRLYYRFYIPDGSVRVPVHLKPHSMEKLHGLRARAIRSMFILNSTLASRVASKGCMDDEPHVLRGQRCLLAWHQPAATRGWQFCFKFQKPYFQCLSSRPVRKEDVYNGYNDPFYNPEEGCSVLQVTCCHFASVAAVMGLLLNQVYLTLSSGLRHHRLRLHFDSRPVAHHSKTSDVVVVIDDVLGIKVMPWWHPQYPFNT